MNDASVGSRLRWMMSMVLMMTILMSATLFAETVYRFAFDTDPQAAGWEVESEAGEQTFNPAEGYHPSKGGKLRGPKIVCVPGARDYSIAFDSRAAGAGFYFVQFERADGALIVSDDYGSVDSSGEWVRNQHVFSTREGAVSFRVGFQGKKRIEVRNFEIDVVGHEEALGIARAEGGPVPAGILAAIPGANLPRLRRHLEERTPCRLVLLGDSIMNDLYNSDFQLDLDERYPGNQVKVICSVRGSTGCWYYQDDEAFAEYVTALKPDVLFIGGISHRNDLEATRKVISRAQSLGCEVALLSGPMGDDWREPQNQENTLPFQQSVSQNLTDELRDAAEFVPMQRELAAETGVDFLDLFNSWHEFLGASEKPWRWYHRDRVHANDRGKFVLGRLMTKHLTGE